MKLIIKIALGIILALVLLLAGCGALVAASSDDVDKALDEAAASPSLVEDAPAAEEEAVEEEASDETAGQENARRSAESYLSHSAFSRSGLIGQLKFEGYSTADATYGVDAVSPDWNQQAAKSAESYLSHSAFSRSGLIGQLKFEGYTTEQATYGVDEAGL